MKKTNFIYYFIVIVLLSFTHLAVAVPANVNIGKMFWHDEFRSQSLDLTKWNYRYTGLRNSAINTPNAVTVERGQLVITTYTNKGIHYTGMIGTQDKFEMTYGYVEARMKFHNMPANWSAFWLQSPTFGTPIGSPDIAGTEIDIIEHRMANQTNSDVSSYIVNAIHWDGYASSHKSIGNMVSFKQTLSQDTWHTYGVLWTPTSYSFYFDDKLVWTTTTAVSDRSEYLILSSAIRNNSWAGTIPTTGYGSLTKSRCQTKVDYVRAYKLKT
ncbi:MAG: glycoside hydrolase family 16 protein [Methylococcaceae bacterium]